MNEVIECSRLGISTFSGARHLVVALAASAAICAVQAAEQDPALLGTKLTPLGAEAAASADGAIPAWAAPGPQGGNWSYGEVRGQHWKFKDDKPLYSIDASNVSQHASKLAPAQLELFNKLPGFRMDVYPTRRSCGVPDFVAENTKKNLGFATLDSAGLALQEAHVPGIPFPMPTTGAEVMWNMKMHYRGVGFVMSRPSLASRRARPVATGCVPRWTGTCTPRGEKGSSLFSSHDRLETATYFSYYDPVSLAGQAGVLTTKAGEETTTFYYFPGQRRVRRMPAYSYDAPQIGLDNQYTIDESNIFYGPWIASTGN